MYLQPFSPPGASGSDLALAKPPSQIGLRRAEPSLLDLSRKAEQKPSAPCPQLNGRKFEFACNSPLKRSTLCCRSSTTCGFLQVSDPSTPLLGSLAPSQATPIYHRQPPLLLWDNLVFFGTTTIKKPFLVRLSRGSWFRDIVWLK